MALFSKRVVLLLLAALVLLSLAVRYPLIEHERFQTDSYTMHLYAKSIVDFGYAKWTFHFLSYFGYYPISYPSGVPFLVAEVAELTGTSVEVSILIVDMLLGIIFCLGVFVLSRQFIARPEFVVMATFFSIMGARFVDTTYWDGSARGPMVVLMALVIFAAFRASQTGQRRLIGLAGLLAIGCFATHHMAILLLLVGAGYLMAAFQAQLLFPRFRTRKTQSALLWNLMVILVVITTAFTFFDYFGNLALMNLRTSSLFDVEPAFLSVFLNIGVSYANQIGVIVIFAVLAVPIIFRSAHISTERMFLVTLPIAFIPMLGNSLYVSMLLAPFMACLGTIWIARAVRSKRRVLIALFLVVLFAATVFMPVWSSAKWNSRAYLSGDTVEVDMRAYSDSTYLSAMYPERFAICNVNTLWIQLAVGSDTRFAASGVPAAINGDITVEDMRRNATWSDEEFPANLYQWFEYDGEPNIDMYVLGLVVQGMSVISGSNRDSDGSRYFANHSKLLVAMDNTRPHQYVGVYDVRDSALSVQLADAAWGGTKLPSYAIYQSGRVTVYAVQLFG